MRTVVATVLALALAAPAAAEPFRVVAFGDMPYGPSETSVPPVERLIEAIDARKPWLVLHVGDIKGGSEPCTDDLLRERIGLLQRIRAPVLYTPGDNEWTDCHREKAGGLDPRERLDLLRRLAFADPGRSLGVRPVAVESQAAAMGERFAGFPENRRVALNGVLFVTVHVVGSNNGFEIRDPKAVEEFFEREEAVVSWLRDSFALARERGLRAVVVAMQADMFSELFDADSETFRGASGFARIGAVLAGEAAAFGRPVLLVYGDSHTFELHRPFPNRAPNLLALQVFGDRDTHAVEILVDPDDPAVFAVRPLWNPDVAPRG